MVKFPTDPVTAEDITRLDKNSSTLGIPTGYLMECAGLQATNKLMEKYPLSPESLVVIFSGTGNNGGDGMVIARHLASRGVPCHIALVGDPTRIRTEDARRNWAILQQLNLSVKISILKDSSQVKTFLPLPDQTPIIIVDALLGTGISGYIREPIASAIDAINKFAGSKIKIISIDVPSGQDPNTGEIPVKAVACDFRITFHRDKIGLDSTTQPDVWIASIGVPPEAEYLVGEGDLQMAIKPRKKHAHKGKYGKMLVIGGSDKYPGAPALASLAALEFGLDLVITFAPKGIASVIRSYSPNLIVREGFGDNFGPKDFPLAQELCDWADAVLIGPGLGEHSSTRQFFEEFILWLLKSQIPCVVDADGLKFLGDMIRNSQLDAFPPHCVLTPHLAELRRIVDVPEFTLFSETDSIPRGEYMFQTTQAIGGVFLIKGVEDLIVNNSSQDIAPFRRYRFNRTGTPEMTVGGTGDVLAGLTTAFLALKTPPFLSACASAYLNGKLGEEAVKCHGSRIRATDLISSIRDILHPYY
ncbi:MAG: NAD(P)H-hydrate dehydratase [Promethearchaeota archaeon]